MKNKLVGLTNGVTYHKGVDYFVDDKIENVKQVSDGEYTSDVKGSSVYHVQLNVDEPHLSTCTCPYFEENKKICKHIVATYLSIYPELAKEEDDVIHSFLSKMAKRRGVVRKSKPKNIKKEVDPLVEKDKKAKKITRQYQLIPVSKDEVVTVSYDDKEYTYHPFEVGQRIRQLRLERKLTKDYIAKEYFDLTAFDISRWEVGYLPSLEDLDNLAWWVFDTSLEFLLTGKEEDENVDKEELAALEKQKRLETLRQKNIELGKHSILEYNSIDDFDIYNEDVLKKVNIENYYRIKDFSEKIFRLEFSNKVTSDKKYHYSALTIKLTYRIRFGDETLYLADDSRYYPLTKKKVRFYFDLVNKICDFDKRLSELVDLNEEDKTISKELKMLKTLLSLFVEENSDCITDDDRYFKAYGSKHYVYNKKEDKKYIRISKKKSGLSMDDVIFIEEFLE